MDKYEYKLKLEQIKALASEGDFKTAAEIADTVNWRKVRNVNSLCKVAEVYENVGRLEDSRDMLLLAYDRSPIGRMIIYRLAMVAIRMNSMEEADEYYQEFVDIAPHDNLKYIIRYKIHKAQGKDLSVQIQDLEDLKAQEYTEEWAYELAYLYSKANLQEQCVENCDELILWFGEGKYVEKALKLKLRYQPLTPQQEQKLYKIQEQEDSWEEQQEERPVAVKEPLREPVQEIQYEIHQETQKEQDQVLEEVLESQEQFLAEDISMEMIHEELMRDMDQVLGESEFATIPQGTSVDMPLEETEGLSEDLQEELQEQTEEENISQVQGPTIAAILAEWEETKRAARQALQEAEEKRRRAAKEKALKEAEDILEQLVDVMSQKDLEDIYMKFQDAENMTAEEAGMLVSDMNELLQREIDRLKKQEQQKQLGEGFEAQEAEQIESDGSEIGVFSFDDMYEEEETMDRPLGEVEEIPTETNHVTVGRIEVAIPHIHLELPDMEGIDIPEIEMEDLDDFEENLSATAQEIQKNVEQWKEEKELEPEPGTEEMIQKEPTQRMPDLNSILRKNKEAIKQQSDMFEKAEEAAKRYVEELREPEEVQEDLAQAMEAERIAEEAMRDLRQDIEDIDEIEGSVSEGIEESEVVSEESSEEISEEILEDISEKMQQELTEEAPEEITPKLTFEQLDEVIPKAGQAIEERPAESFLEYRRRSQALEEEIKNDISEEYLARLEAAVQRAEFMNIEETDSVEDVEDNFARAQQALEKVMQNAEMQEIEPLEAIEMETVQDITRDRRSKSVQEANFRRVVEQRTKRSGKAGNRLPKEIRGIFSYFIPVTGMEAQLCETLVGIVEKRSNRTDSITGNIAIQGIRGSGKTVLAADLIKALQKLTGNTGKVGKIEASSLNQKDVASVVKKVAGGYLIIERAGDLSRETATRLSLIMERDTKGLIVILEDTKAGISKALGRDVSFAKKFTERVNIPYFTSDELVAFGRAYAKDMGYRIDEMGVLALYNRISNIQKLDQATTLTEIKEIIDEAIAQSEKGGIKKFFGIFTTKKNGDDEYIPLREKDFE